MEGNIYFIQVGQDGPIKIGWTKRGVVIRFREWCGEVPWADLRFLAKLPGGRSREKKIHNLFRKDMIVPSTPKGVKPILETEWFYPSKSLLGYVNRLQDRLLS